MEQNKYWPGELDNLFIFLYTQNFDKIYSNNNKAVVIRMIILLNYLKKWEVSGKVFPRVLKKVMPLPRLKQSYVNALKTWKN